jgi:DNA-binding SARP family transcriptional activator
VIEYGVLGPLTVSRRGVALPVPTKMLRRLLALLLAHAGSPVSADLLIEHLWAGQPPASARRTLSAYVSRLRGLHLPDASVESGAGGYALRPLPGQLDAARFGHLAAQSREAGARGSADVAVALARDALGLWRGPAYDGLRDLEPVAAEASRLEQLRLSAFEYWASLLLDAGRADEALAGLQEMVTENPYRERLRAQHMLALYRVGRRAESLEAYRETYATFARELGVEPGPDIRGLHQDILAGSPGLALGPRAAPAVRLADGSGDGEPVPAQLPRDLFGFVGRGADVRGLADILMTARRGTAGLVIAAITGMPGVGKTALATHVAHRVAGAFPDGQLYVNMHGHDAAPPRRAASVLQAFLVALGEPAADLPADADDVAALYRSRLAGRRILLFLDNARDPADIRPLLPGAPGCAVIVTGRTRMADLAVSDGAVVWPIDVLDHDDACEMLTQRVRQAGDAAATGEIAELCARLPLALSIAAARAGDMSLASVAAGLRAADTPLSALDLGGGGASLRAVFTWSYDKLSGGAADLFRSLAWHPPGELDVYAAAAVSGRPLPETTRGLAELTDARLVADQGDARFDVHDLLRAYARELSRPADSQLAEAAARRHDDHLLHTAHLAARLIQPHRAMVALAEPAAGAIPAPLTDRAAAVAWLGRNHGRLIAAVQEAHAAGRHDYVWRLAWCLTEYLNLHGYHRDWLAVQRLALDAAEHGGDRTAIATGCRNLARAAMWLSRFGEASALLQRALAVAVADGSARSRAITLMSMAELADMASDHGAALARVLEALAAYDEAGDATGRVYAVLAIAGQYAHEGQHELAVRYGGEAMAELGRRGDEVGLAYAYAKHGAIYGLRGDHEASIGWYRRASDSLRGLGHQPDEADALDALGDAYQAAGDRGAAAAAWRQSLAIFEPLGDARAASVRRKLSGPGEGARPATAGTRSS